MRKLIVLVAAASALWVAGCNTVAGVGKDVAAAGKAVTKPPTTPSTNAGHELTNGATKCRRRRQVRRMRRRGFPSRARTGPYAAPWQRSFIRCGVRCSAA